VGLRDVTFREGDDCVGYLVSVEDKLEMLRLAVEMGVEEIDIGGPSMHQHQFDFGKAVQNSGIKVRTTGRFFANNTKDFKRDVDMCVEAGSTNIRIVLMYLNEETIYNQLKCSRRWWNTAIRKRRKSPGGSPICREPVWNWP